MDPVLEPYSRMDGMVTVVVCLVIAVFLILIVIISITTRQHEQQKDAKTGIQLPVIPTPDVHLSDAQIEHRKSFEQYCERNTINPTCRAYCKQLKEQNVAHACTNYCSSPATDWELNKECEVTPALQKVRSAFRQREILHNKRASDKSRVSKTKWKRESRRLRE